MYNIVDIFLLKNYFLNKFFLGVVDLKFRLPLVEILLKVEVVAWPFVNVRADPDVDFREILEERNAEELVLVKSLALKRFKSFLVGCADIFVKLNHEDDVGLVRKVNICL